MIKVMTTMVIKVMMTMMIKNFVGIVKVFLQALQKGGEQINGDEKVVAGGPEVIILVIMFMLVILWLCGCSCSYWRSYW